MEKDVCVYIPKKVKLERVVVMKTPQTTDPPQGINTAAWNLSVACTVFFEQKYRDKPIEVIGVVYGVGFFYSCTTAAVFSELHDQLDNLERHE